MESKRDTPLGKAMTRPEPSNLPEKINPIETKAEIKSPREFVNASDCSEQEKLLTNNPGPTLHRSIRTRKEHVKLKDYVRH